MHKTTQQQLGSKGEQLAAAFLIKNGHRIIQQNFRSGRSELDIISVFGQTIVISEVKSYFSPPLGAAELRVHKHKQRQLIQGAYAFLDQHEAYSGMDVRFDVIIVDFSKYPAKITIHEGAFWDEDTWLA
ncbi:MAG: YraN family protein [Caldithrix sp.]|nr:YraN family protein [Caldithrix sp.]